MGEEYDPATLEVEGTEYEVEETEACFGDECVEETEACFGDECVEEPEEACFGDECVDTDDTTDPTYIQKIESGLENMFYEAETYLGYSFLQLSKSRVMKSETQYCACKNGQVIQYA